MIFLLVPVAVALLAMPIVRHAPLHAAFLAGWAALTLLAFVPGGFLCAMNFAGEGNIGGLLIGGVSISGLVAVGLMLRRLSRLHRKQALGSARYLVIHHAAVVVAFFVAELVAARGGYPLSLFCLAACAVGAAIVACNDAEVPSVDGCPQPVAF